MASHREDAVNAVGTNRTTPTRARRCRRLFSLVCLPLALLVGCTAIQDTIGPIKFDPAKMIHPPEPLSVIRNSSNGDERADAYRSLKEPLTHGGSQDQQEIVIKALRYGATSEPQSLCRMAAIDTLRSFRDPRTVDILKEAYYKSSSFLPDTGSVVRCHSLDALGETRDPTAVEFLVKVLREPKIEGTDVDRQQKLDERIAAAGALGNFSHHEAMGALTEVLTKEEDVVLRKRAHDSLVHATGRELPPNAQAWNDFFANPGTKDHLGPRQGDAWGRLVNWVTGPDHPSSQQMPPAPQPTKP